MEQYLKTIYDIYNRLSIEEKEYFFPGPKLVRVDHNSPQYLILGINSSNSYKQHAEFSKEVCDDLSELYRLRLNGYKKESQEQFNDFLSFKNFEQHKEHICKLEKLARIYHNHYERHRDFAEKLGLSKEHYAFFDLLPLWEVSQKLLLRKFEKHPKLKKKLLNEFLKLIDRNQSIEGLLFFNRQSYEEFSNMNKPREMSYQLEEKYRVQKKFQKNNSYPWAILEGSLLLKGVRKIKVWCFGLVASYRFIEKYEKEITYVADEFKHKFK